MAAPGLFTSVKVEIQFVPGRWDDVSGDVALESGVQIEQGRQSETEDLSPGQATFVLRNDTGKYTPNNPTSSLWPYVTEGRPVRISVIKSATTYRRFTGSTSRFDPEFPDDDSNVGDVKVIALDPLAALANRLLLNPHIEEQQRLGRLFGVWTDVYSFHKRARTSPRSPLYFTNYGFQDDGVTQSVGSMKLMYTGHGASQLSTPDGLDTNAAIDLLPRLKYQSGPILKVIPGAAATTPSFPERLEFWFKVPSSYALASGSSIIVDAWQNSGGLTLSVFSIRIRSVSGVLRLSQYDTGGVFDQDINDEDGNAATIINDDVWHKLTIASDSAPGPTACWLDDLYSTKITMFQDLQGCDVFYLGGGSSPYRESKAVECPVISFAAIALAGDTNGGLRNFPGVPTAFITGAPSLTDAETRYYEILGYGNKAFTQRFTSNTTYTATSTTVTSTDPIFTSNDVGAGIGVNVAAIPPNAKIQAVVSPKQITMTVPATASGSSNLLIGPAMIGSDVRNIARISTSDSQNIQAALQDLARSWGGMVWADVFGNINLINPDGINPISPLASLDLEGDLLADELELSRDVTTVPTRVTVSGPIGDLIYVDFARESGVSTGQPYRQEATINAGSANDADAYGLGGYFATRSKGLRIVKIGLDLVTAQTDLYSTFLTSGSLYPGVRLRGNGLPSSIFGATRSDVVVQGWTEVYDATSAVFTFDLTPADDPPQGVWDDTEFGRWAGGDTAFVLGYPVTNAATAIVTAPGNNSGIAFTTSAGDYPLDLDILGERVTSAGVPGTLARTNSVTNPSFEVNTTGWAGFASATIARSTILSSEIDGSVSGLVTWPTAVAFASAVGYAFAVTNGVTYSFSVYVYVPSGSPRVQIGELSSLGSSVTYTRQDTTGYNDAWVRLGVTLTAAATTTYTFVVRNVDASVSGQVCFIDAALLEATSRGVGSYFDGSNAGGAWTGTADASTSTQTAQTFTVTRGVSPTVARAHDSGEMVDVYHAFTWAI